MDMQIIPQLVKMRHLPQGMELLLIKNSTNSGGFAVASRSGSLFANALVRSRFAL